MYRLIYNAVFPEFFKVIGWIVSENDFKVSFINVNKRYTTIK